jgi:hypothetical protein
MKTNQMHYLSLIYFISQPLHVSGMFIANNQEVFTIYVQQLVRVKRLSWLAAIRVRMEHNIKPSIWYWASGHHWYSLGAEKTISRTAVCSLCELHLFLTWVTSANHSFGMYVLFNPTAWRSEDTAVLTFKNILFCHFKRRLFRYSALTYWPLYWILYVVR